MAEHMAEFAAPEFVDPATRPSCSDKTRRGGGSSSISALPNTVRESQDKAGRLRAPGHTHKHTLTLKTHTYSNRKWHIVWHKVIHKSLAHAYEDSLNFSLFHSHSVQTVHTLTYSMFILLQRIHIDRVNSLVLSLMLRSPQTRHENVFRFMCERSIKRTHTISLKSHFTQFTNNKLNFTLSSERCTCISFVFYLSRVKVERGYRPI